MVQNIQIFKSVVSVVLYLNHTMYRNEELE